MLWVVVAGVPVEGVVDTAADISVVAAEAFKCIAAAAKLRRRDIKLVDKTPCTYHQRTFHPDGQLEVNITFDG